MTAAQTLSVVHGLVGNVRVIMEGEQCLHDLLLTFLKDTRSIRWQGINRWYSTRSGYVFREIGIPLLLIWGHSRSSPNAQRNEQDETSVVP